MSNFNDPSTRKEKTFGKLQFFMFNQLWFTRSLMVKASGKFHKRSSLNREDSTDRLQSANEFSSSHKGQGTYLRTRITSWWIMRFQTGDSCHFVGRQVGTRDSTSVIKHQTLPVVVIGVSQFVDPTHAPRSTIVSINYTRISAWHTLCRAPFHSHPSPWAHVFTLILVNTS